MARNNFPRQRSPVQQEEHQLSDDSQNACRGNACHRPGCTRACNQRNSGEEFNINLTDKRSTNPSQPNSQTAPPPRPQTNNSSQQTRTPVMSQGGLQQTSQDIKHYFQKTPGIKGEHECTHGWPGFVPVGLHTFKIETQICVSNKVQVTQIRRSSTRKNTSTCHLIKKSDTNRI